MQNARMTACRDDNQLRIEFRDPSTGRMLITALVDWSSVADAFAKGGLDRYPANAQVEIHELAAETPMQQERTKHLVQVPAFGDYIDDATKQRLWNEALRPYEVMGWKAVPGQMGNRALIKRRLPDGEELYEIDFVRLTPVVVAPTEVPAS